MECEGTAPSATRIRTTEEHPMSEKNINEQLKAKIDEIDFDTKIAQVTEAAHKAFDQIREQAASLLSENRGKVVEIIDKATAAFDEKTEGKYHDKVAKAKASFASGLDKLSQRGRLRQGGRRRAGQCRRQHRRLRVLRHGLGAGDRRRRRGRRGRAGREQRARAGHRPRGRRHHPALSRAPGVTDRSKKWPNGPIPIRRLARAAGRALHLTSAGVCENPGGAPP